jgi:hypothetical protein
MDFRLDYAGLRVFGELRGIDCVELSKTAWNWVVVPCHSPAYFYPQAHTMKSDSFCRRNREGAAIMVLAQGVML